LKKTNKILIIIQRSNGDVFLSHSLIKALYENYDSPIIDILVNDDTLAIASLIPFVRKIITFSYKEKENNRWKQEKKIITKIFYQYDLSVNLTSSDRSVIYTLLSGKKTISSIEFNKKKSWWKKLFLSKFYFFDSSKHILENNLKPLELLKLKFPNAHFPIESSNEAALNMEEKLNLKKITEFIIFHPSAQYQYKVYPEHLRNTLLENLSKLGVPIIITGGSHSIDNQIKEKIPKLPNLFDFIGETSIDEFISLSKLSKGYIGMDTLNMHIAASQNKPIFAIFGPTNLKMWSPWSNNAKLQVSQDRSIQSYGNVTIFLAKMQCVPCGRAGCDNQNGRSDCLFNIDPMKIFEVIKDWNYRDELQ
jgi:heptosyltransferase III